MRKTWIAALTVPMAVAALASPASAETKAPPNQQMTITFDAANPSAAGTVVATGPISGSGTATTSKHHHAGPAHFDANLLTFSSGTVKVRDLHSRGSRKVDSSTCIATQSGKGGFAITGGTGGYAKAKGRGHFTLTATLQGTHDSTAKHGCSFKTVTGSVVITASGHVTV